MAVNILTITVSPGQQVGKYTFTAIEAIGTGFITAQLQVNPPPVGENYYVDFNDPSVSPGSNAFVMGTTDGTVYTPGGTGGFIPNPYCYQVDFVDNVGGLNLVLATNALNLSPMTVPGLTVNPGSAVAHIDWTPRVNSGGVWIAGACPQVQPCLRDDTLVRTPHGAVAISALRAGDLVFDHRGQLQPLISNIAVGNSKAFVRIQRGALASDTPSADLYIRAGHPVLVAGKEVDCEKLVDGQRVEEVELEKPARIYTLCTESRTFVDMQGVLVGTWSQAAFDNFVANDRAGLRLTFEKQ